MVPARSAPSTSFSPTIAAGVAFKLIELATDAGVPISALRQVDLPPPTAHFVETRIPFQRLLELWEVAMRVLREPGFPIAIASKVRPSDYSIAGFACMTRANLREALALAVRYNAIWTDAHRWNIHEGSDTVSMA